MRNKDDFEREFKRRQRMMVVGQVVATLVSLAVLGFLGWVIVMVMRYFGVI